MLDHGGGRWRDVVGRVRAHQDEVEPVGGAEEEDFVVCRCERVRKSDVVKEIRAGVRDMNVIKSVCRAGMGACAGRTCTELVQRIFREEGIPAGEVTPGTYRPFAAEVPLSAFAGVEEDDEE